MFAINDASDLAFYLAGFRSHRIERVLMADGIEAVLSSPNGSGPASCLVPQHAHGAIVVGVVLAQLAQASAQLRPLRLAEF